MIIGFSTCLATLIAGLQLFHEFRKGVDRIHRELNYVKVANLSPITTSLWDLAEENVQLQREGLVNHPDIVYAAITINGNITAKAGVKLDSDVIT